MIQLNDINRIKQLALSGEHLIYVQDGNKEGLILAAKYSKGYWENITLEKLHRIVVY